MSYSLPHHTFAELKVCERVQINFYRNKTPGYHWDTLPPPTLLKMPCKVWKRFFFRIFCFFIIFSKFSNFNFFLNFIQKTSETRWLNNFRKQCHLTSFLEKLRHDLRFWIFWRIFLKEAVYVSKKTQNLNVLRILTLPVAFLCKIARI